MRVLVNPKRLLIRALVVSTLALAVFGGAAASQPQAAQAMPPRDTYRCPSPPGMMFLGKKVVSGAEIRLLDITILRQDFSLQQAFQVCLYRQGATGAMFGYRLGGGDLKNPF